MARHDSSSAALERQREVFRQMSPAQRVQAAAEMSEDVRALADAGIRHRNPGLSDTRVQAALVELLVGRIAPPDDGAPEPDRR